MVRYREWARVCNEELVIVYLKKICRLVIGSSDVNTTDIFPNSWCVGEVSKLVPLHAGYRIFRNLEFYLKNAYLLADLQIMIYILIIKPTRCTNFSNLFYFGMNLYMFHSRLNKFEKLVHLVGFIIRIFHDTRSHESKKK